MGQGSRIKISSSPASRTEAGQIYRRLLLFRRTTIGLGGKRLLVSYPDEWSFGYETTTDPRANDYCCRFDLLPFRTCSLVTLLAHSIAI